MAEAGDLCWGGAGGAASPVRLGFGGAAIGNLYQPIDDAAARGAVEAALAAGVTLFDTAPHYGFGLSEHRLGQALADLDPTGRAVLSTKVGRVLQPVGDDADRERHGFVDAWPFEPVFDYSFDGVLRSHDASRERLGRPVDILLAHDLGAATHGPEHAARMAQFLRGGLAAMQRLKAEGAVSAIGIGVNECAVCEALLAEAELDVVLLAGRYTLLEDGAAATLLPLCEARGVKVIVGGPYNSGVLARGEGAAGPARHNYAPAPRAVLDRVEALEAACAAFGAPLGAAALQFPLRHPAVAAVIPGAANAAEVRQAADWMSRPIPEALWTELAALRAPSPGQRAAA